MSSGPSHVTVMWMTNSRTCLLDNIICNLYIISSTCHASVLDDGWVCVVDTNSRVCWSVPLRDHTRRGRCQQHIQPLSIRWYKEFCSLATNILLIKSKLTLESWVLVVRIAMSPRNIDGQLSSRPQRRSGKCTTIMFQWPILQNCLHML